MLLSVGTAICGGSAIAAVAPVIRAKDEEVTLALATVFLLNAAALVVFPPSATHSPSGPSASGRPWPSTTPAPWWAPAARP